MDYTVVYTNNKVIPAQLNAVRGAMNVVLPDDRWVNKLRPGEGIVKDNSDYPPVQYKILKNKLAFVFTGAGLELLDVCQPMLNGLDLNVNGQRFDIEVKEVLSYTCNHLSELNEFRHYYNESGWLPMKGEYFRLHKTNFPEFYGDEKVKHRIIRSVEEIQFFEEALAVHIRLVASNDGSREDIAKIRVRIISTAIFHDTVLYKNDQSSTGKAPNSRLSNFFFMTNAYLSPHLGYGRGAAIGFGMMTPK